MYVSTDVAITSYTMNVFILIAIVFIPTFASNRLNYRGSELDKVKHISLVCMSCIQIIFCMQLTLRSLKRNTNMLGERSERLYPYRMLGNAQLLTPAVGGAAAGAMHAVTGAL